MVVRSKNTKQLRACKVMAGQTAMQRELIETEIKLVKQMNHPNIVKLYEVYFEEGPEKRVSNGNIYLIFELCEGGDLFGRILHHYERLKQPKMMPTVNGKSLISSHERKKVMVRAGTPHYM